MQIFATFGLLILMQSTVLALTRGEGLSVSVSAERTVVSLWSVRANGGCLIAFAAATALSGGLVLFLRTTMAGKAVRGVIQERDAARLMGINVERTYLLVFATGSALAGVAGCLLAPISNAYVLDILISAFLFAGLASAWNIIGGFGGQFSLGHGVFFAAGAYTVAQFYRRAGVSPWLGLIAGAAVGTEIATLVSWPTFRLRGPFFAIATMAVNEVGLVLVNTLDGLTGGPEGLMIPFRPSLGAMMFAERWRYATGATPTPTTTLTMCSKKWAWPGAPMSQ